VLFALDARLAGLGYAIRTPGARFARAMLLAPIAVVVGRTLLFYEPTMFAYGAFAFCAGIALFFVAPRALGETVACALLRAAATMGASLGALLMFAHFLFSSPYPLFALLVLPPAATTAALSFFAGEQDSWYRLGAALFACAGLSANTLFCWDFDHLTAAGSIALVAGIAVLLLGFSAGQRLVFACGAATALLGFFQVMAAAIELESLKNWGALSLMGVSLIFTAALVERHAGRLLRYGRALRARLNAW
jgi:hypothetical protein